MDLPPTLKALRAGRSQQQFATELGVSIVTYNRWENGNRRPTSYRHVVALNRAGVPIELLTATKERTAAS